MMKKIRSRKGHIAEFPLALGVFFLITLFPLINLVSFTCGAATLYLCAHQASHQAACATSFPAALQGAVNQSVQIEQSGLGQFAKIVPVGGMAGSGMNLFLYAINYQNSSSSIYGPNSPLAPPIDTATNIYEVEAKVLADVGPFLNLSGVPFVGNIPLIGKPARLQFTNRAAVEHPEGLVGNPIAALVATIANPGTGQSLPSSPPSSTPNPQGTGSYTLANSSGWNYPGVFTYKVWEPDPNTVGGGYMVDITTTPTFLDTNNDGFPDKVTLDTTITGQHLITQSSTPGNVLTGQDVFSYQNANGQTISYVIDPGVNYTSSISNQFSVARGMDNTAIVFNAGNSESGSVNIYDMANSLGQGPTTATSIVALQQFMDWATSLGF